MIKNNITIREAVNSDAERIHEIQCAAVRGLCSAVYSPEIIEGWLKNRSPAHYLRNIPAWNMYVAETEEKTVGFGGAVPGEIISTYVDPAYARRGIGTALMRYGMKIANVKAPGVIRIQSTKNARPFYETFGFKVIRDIILRRNDVEFPCYEMFRTGDAE